MDAGGPSLNQNKGLLELQQEVDRSVSSTFARILHENQSRLVPIAGYLMAERRLASDPDDAYFWFSVAGLRARYDALRCSNQRAARGIAVLPSIARNVQEAAQRDFEAFAAAGLRATEWNGLFEYSTDPSWICIHGSSFRGESAESYVPRSEWAGIRSELLASAKKRYSQMAISAEDPIPDRTESYELETVASGKDLSKYAWLNESTLIFAQSTGREDARKALMEWRPGAPPKKVVDVAGSWCAGSDRLVYELEKKISADGEGNTLVFAEATSQGERVSEIDAASRFQSAEIVQKPSHSGAYSSAPQHAYVQSVIDCRWDHAEGLFARKGYNWMPLREGDGYFAVKVSTRSASVTESDGEKTPLVSYFRSHESEPLPLPIDTPIRYSDCIRYYSFADAYFVSYCAPERDQLEKFRQEGCVPSYWMNPKDGSVQRSCTPVDSVNESYVTLVPSKPGMLRIVSARETARGRRVGGVYLSGSGGQTAKVFQGWLESVSVSPGGCMVAILSRPAGIDGRMEFGEPKSLHVLDLCDPKG